MNVPRPGLQQTRTSELRARITMLFHQRNKKDVAARTRSRAYRGETNPFAFGPSLICLDSIPKLKHICAPRYAKSNSLRCAEAEAWRATDGGPKRLSRAKVTSRER